MTPVNTLQFTQDLLETISSHLLFSEQLALSSTCRRFRSMPPIFPKPAHQKICQACIKFEDLTLARIFAKALSDPSATLEAIAEAHIGSGNLIEAEKTALAIPCLRRQSSVLDSLFQLYLLMEAPGPAARIGHLILHPDYTAPTQNLLDIRKSLKI